MNDSYWVVEDEFDGKFENYNLYENNFSRTLALIAYTGHGSSVARGFTSSPEFTTNGMLKKCWRRVDGKIYLYKGGTMGRRIPVRSLIRNFMLLRLLKQWALSMLITT